MSSRQARPHPQLPFAETIEICKSDELPEGGTVRFEIPRQGRWPLPCFAVRKKGNVAAFVNRCAHWPVTLDMETGDFWDYEHHYLQCRTHGALYDLKGLCVAGPCTGESLVPLPVEERAGQVVLDRSRMPPGAFL